MKYSQFFSANFIQARYPKYEIKSWESFDNYAPLQSPPRRADRGNEAWSRPHGPKAVDSTTLLSFIFRGSEVLTLAGFVCFLCGFDSFLNENKNRQNTSKHCQILPKYNNSLSRQNVVIADSALQNTSFHLEDKCIQLQDFVLICFRCIELPWSGAQMEP